MQNVFLNWTSSSSNGLVPNRRQAINWTNDDLNNRGIHMYFPRYWVFVRGVHLSPVNSPRKGQWRGVLMFSLICAWTNGWVNNCEAGDLRRHYYVTVFKGCYTTGMKNVVKSSFFNKWFVRYVLVNFVLFADEICSYSHLMTCSKCW